MTPVSNELPLDIQRDHNTYLSGAYPLCVILTDPRKLTWFYSRYIQLYSLDLRGRSLPAYIDFADSLSCRDALNSTTLDRAAVLHAGSIIRVIKDAVNDGKHLVVFTNGSMLRGEDESSVHEFLVYGYDDGAREVRCVGFGDEVRGFRPFTTISFDYDLFEASFESALDLTAPGARDDGYANLVLLLESRELREEFEPQVLAASIDSYLNSSPVDVMGERMRYWWWFAAKNDYPIGDPVSTGLNVYNDVLLHLDAVGSGREQLEYRMFHLLWEHKEGISKRIKYLQTSYRLDNLDEILARAQARALEFKILRMRILLSRGDQAESGLESVIATVESTRKNEASDLAYLRDVASSL